MRCCHRQKVARVDHTLRRHAPGRKQAFRAVRQFVTRRPSRRAELQQRGDQAAKRPSARRQVCGLTTLAPDTCGVPGGTLRLKVGSGEVTEACPAGARAHGRLDGRPSSSLRRLARSPAALGEPWLCYRCSRAVLVPLASRRIALRRTALLIFTGCSTSSGMAERAPVDG